MVYELLIRYRCRAACRIQYRFVIKEDFSGGGNARQVGFKDRMGGSLCGGDVRAFYGRGGYRFVPTLRAFFRAAYSGGSIVDGKVQP